MNKQKCLIALLAIISASSIGRTAEGAVPGSVAMWRYDDYLEEDLPVETQNEVIAIAAGNAHIAVLKSDGSVFAWGRNDFGQTIVPVGAQAGVTAIAAGVFHTVALKTDGSVIAWG